MMRALRLTFTVAALVAMAGGAGFAVDPDWRTQPPITYVLDYGREHIDDADYIEAVAGSPPTLLHLGKDLVMSHLWGPIAGVGGENVAGGNDPEYIRRLTPEETWERYRALERMVDNLHEAGVRWVMPYICSITIGGHHERREGFWEFYDHWDEYLEFGLPPRPELDPADWMQRTEDGWMQSTYGTRPDRDEFYPRWEPLQRYAACVNNPGWRTWLDAVVRLVAEVGYDGAFVDNAGTQRCYCTFCQAKYQDYLREKYTDAEIRQLFGVGPEGRVELTPRPGRGDEITLGWVETQRFWRESLYEHHEAIRRAGEEVADRFIIFPNGVHRRPEVVQTAFRGSDYAMYELSTGEYGTNPGLVRARIVGDLYMNVRNHHIWQLKHMEATREGVGALLLTRGGYPSQRPPLILNDATAALGNAQAGAFGSGSGFLLRPRWDEYRDVLNTYRGFFEEHADLYSGLVPHAQVAVVAFGEQNFYEHARHISTVGDITDELSAKQVLFDYLTEKRLTPEEIAQFDAVIFADVKYATGDHIAALDDYVSGGGTVMVVGDTPTHDLQMRELDAQSLPVGLRPGAPGEHREDYLPHGEGCWLRYSHLPLTDLLTLLRPDAELSIAPDAGPGLRVNAYLNPDEGTPLVVHVLNFDVPLGVDAEPHEPKRDVALSVPLPEGATVVSVRAFEPGREVEEIPHAVDDGRLNLTLPTLDIYRVLRVEMQ